MNQFKNFFKLILKTFVSNDACIEASCIKKITTNIIAIIFALISIAFIPLTTVININGNKGSDWIKQDYIYDFDSGIKEFFKELEKEKIKFSFNNKNELTVKKEEKNLKEYHWFWNKEQLVDGKIINNNYLTIYFTEKSDKEYQTFCEEKENNSNNTFIVFGKKQFNCYFFNQKNKNYEGRLSGDYENNKTNLDSLFTVNDKKEIMNKWKNFFDNAYELRKKKIILNEILYELLIIIPIMFFFGLIVWFLSHTKNNLYRIHSFWTSQKILFYMSLTPSIISFLLGNMIKSLIVFIFLMIFRIQFLNKIFKQNNQL